MKKLIVRKNYKWKQNFLFESIWFQKFLNKLMLKGKAQKTELSVYSIFYNFKKISGVSCLFFFFELLENLRPLIELRTWAVFRNNKTFLQVPVSVKEIRQYQLALNWLILSFKLNKNRGFKVRLFSEFYSNFYKESSIFLEIDKYENISIVNRVYSHYRWVK